MKMGKINRKKLMIWILGGFLGLVFVLFVLGLRMSLELSQKEIETKLKSEGITYKFDKLKTTLGELRYLQTGNENSDTVVLFVHGAPGALDAFLGNVKDSVLMSDYHLITIDRPGYGISPETKVETSINKQAAALSSIFKKFPERKFILVGHSYGGPVVAKMGSLFPEQVTKVILAGGAVSAEDEKFVWLAGICNFPLFRWIMSNGNRVATDEKLSHQKALREIENIWKNYPTQLVVYHGDKDWLVPYGNVDFLQNKVPKDKLEVNKLPGEGHFFVFSQPEILNDEIIKFNPKLSDYHE